MMKLTRKCKYRITFENGKNIRKVTIGFMFIYAFTVVVMTISCIYTRYFSNGDSSRSPTMLSLWMPFDQQSSSGYAVNLLVEFFTASMCAIQSSVYDTTVCSMMFWFSAQLDIFFVMCRGMGEPISPYSVEDLAPESEALRRVGQCQRLHVSILGLCNKLNYLLSPVMFINLCGSSAKLGASISTLVNEPDNFYQILYLGISLTQLFILYWFCNAVTEKSIQVGMAVWQSPWYRYGVRVRRSCLILMMGLQIPVIFTAGPFSKMTLETFLSILQTSYTAYATMINFH